MDTDKVEDLAAKREARRRRIVENAQNRLTRITGRELNAEEAHKIKGSIADSVHFLFTAHTRHFSRTNVLILGHLFCDFCSSTKRQWAARDLSRPRNRT